MDSPSVPPPAPKPSGRGKWLGIGCLVILALLIVGGFIAYMGIKTFLVGLVNQYTDTQPRALPQLTMPESQAQTICARVDVFQAALKAGQATEPLVLSGNDINTLITYHPSWKNTMASIVYVTLENDKIRGEVAIPFDAITKRVKGRYLNGMGIIGVHLVDGRLFIFLDSLEVKGKTVPEEFMKTFRSENLAKKANTDEKTAAFLAKIESITVQNGQMRIVPKKTP